MKTFSDIANYFIGEKKGDLSELTTNYMNSGNYGIYAEGYGIIVLEKGYTGKPLFTEPDQ